MQGLGNCLIDDGKEYQRQTDDLDQISHHQSYQSIDYLSINFGVRLRNTHRTKKPCLIRAHYRHFQHFVYATREAWFSNFSNRFVACQKLG